MSRAIVFAERAIAPGGDAIWPFALEHLARRFASIRELDLAAMPAREDAVPALEAWAGEDVSSWRRELDRFYDDHARVHLRRDPGTAALLAGLRAAGVRLAAYGQGPRETLGDDARVPRARPAPRRRRAGAGRGRLRRVPRGARAWARPSTSRRASSSRRSS